MILEPGDWPDWLHEVDADFLALPHPASEGTLRTWPVSRAMSHSVFGCRTLRPSAP